MRGQNAQFFGTKVSHSATAGDPIQDIPVGPVAIGPLGPAIPPAAFWFYPMIPDVIRDCQPEWILISNMMNHTSMKKHTNVGIETGNCDALRVEVRDALAVLTGTWKLEILFLLGQRLYRFGELRRAIPGITQHMLTTTLRELEKDGLINRTVFLAVP